MRSLVLSVMAVAGCASGSHLRTELVAHGASPVLPTAPSPTIDLAAGTYDLALRFTVPRAQQVTWTVRCADSEHEGVAGETLEQYRARRLSEVTQMNQQRPTLTIGGNARIATPIGTVGTQEAVTIEQAPVELSPDDIGAGVFMAHARFSTRSNGPCAISISAQDENVAATFDITRQVDLAIEAEKQRLAAGNAARVDVRGQLVGQLAIAGADPDAVARREAERTRRAEELEAERARVRAEQARIAMERAQEQARLDALAEAEINKKRAEAQAIADEERRQREAVEAQERAARRAQIQREKAELSIKIERERRIRIEIELRIKRRVFEARTLLVGYLAGTCGADPHRYARLKAKEELEIELRVRMEIEEREKREIAWRIEQQRREAELGRTRTALIAFLGDIGARPRPAKPDLRPENRGVAPFDNAHWIAGAWTWSESDWAWSWTAGWWKDRTSFGDAGTMDREVRAAATIDVREQDPDPVPVIEAPPTTVVVTPPPTTTVVVQQPTTTVVVRPPTIVVKPVLRLPKVRVKVGPRRR